MRQKIILLFIINFLLAGFACQKSLPDKSSNEYREAISAFYVGLAALEVGYDIQAKEKLTQATKLADGEPAAWANLGILQIRQRDFEAAEKSLEKARSIVSDDGRIYALLALLETQRGNFDKAMSHWQKAIELNPKDFKAAYALAQEKERQTDDATAQQLYEKILAANPNNLAAQLEVARLAAKRNDVETLKKTVAQISVRANAWSSEIKEQFDALQKAVNENNLKSAATQVAFLRNVLLRLPEFRNDLATTKPSDTIIGEPFLKPLKLPAPDFAPALPDEALTFASEQIDDAKAVWAKSLILSDEAAPVVAFATNDDEIHVGKSVLPFKTKANSNSIAPIDFDYDFKTDVAIASEKGFRLFKQDANESFVDVTGQTKLSKEILSKPYFGAWVLDVELDGDLDLILATENTLVVLRNNADGSFKEVKAFESVKQLRDFVWADLDEDGDADAVTLDANGRVQFFSNERGGQFREKDLKINKAVVAITVADVNGDGVLDLIALQSDSALVRVENFEAREVLRVVEDNGKWQMADSNIVVADFDNNGGNDVLISGAKESRLWLSDRDAKFKELSSPINARVFSTDEFNKDGRLDLIGLDENQNPVNLINRGTKNYSWQTVRPKGAKITGDQRINSFGIGGEMELRAGLLTQKRIINSPIVHFGLGEQTKADLMRIVWSNGITQAEFDFVPNQSIAAEQRVKGSCPHLYAWNSERFQFVKDAPPWGTVLGVKLNEKDFLPIRRNEEWMRIRGDQLKESDGFYELRITDELGETYYVDNYSMIVVDHPIETEVFVDERYADPPVELTPRLMTTTKSFSSAKDEKGKDVSDVVRSLDENYLGGFERSNYQGLVKEHFVELELPNDAPRDGKLFLVADGWVNLIEGSGYVALSQGNLEQPQSLSLEVADGRGGWKVVQTKLGTPAGVYKTILLDLSNAFVRNAPRRLRLKTNLEIYWDRLGWVVGLPSENIKSERLNLSSAELRYRGFSEMKKANESAPTVPNYERIASTSTQWRDLEGYYTRFGDVKELLFEADERFVIVNAGDEMVLRFTALPLRKDWLRDFIFIGHGWLKDSDTTTVFSQTVTPLPQLNMDYAKKSARLEDDPVYKKHKEDWLRFHTRYVAQDDYKNALRVKR